MPKKALILSDFLTLNPDQDTYLQITNSVLSEQWEVTMCSSRYLAGLTALHSKQQLHEAFISGGIITAAEHVIQDAASYYDLAIGFSIGGTILWKAVENYGLTLSKLICISSTRLRFEKSRLNPKTFLVYGVLDEYAPEQCLAMKLADKHKIIPQVGHDFYRHNPTLLKQTLITLMQENGLPL